jgi:hypothetical protein
VTIFLTTQYLEEADQLSDRIAVLDRGHLVAQGTPDEFKRQIPGSHVRRRFTDVAGLGAAAQVLAGSTRDDEDLALRVPSDGRAKSLRALLARLDEQSIEVEEFSVHTPDLKDPSIPICTYLLSHARRNRSVSCFRPFQGASPPSGVIHGYGNSGAPCLETRAVPEVRCPGGASYRVLARRSRSIGRAAA